MTTYDKDFIAKVKDLAVLGLFPPQIAERLGLVGEDRRTFLHNITDYEHPLCKEYWKSRQNQEEDLEAALQTAAMNGDPKALALAYEVKERRQYDKLAHELFGI